MTPVSIRQSEDCMEAEGSGKVSMESDLRKAEMLRMSAIICFNECLTTDGRLIRRASEEQSEKTSAGGMKSRMSMSPNAPLQPILTVCLSRFSTKAWRRSRRRGSPGCQSSDMCVAWRLLGLCSSSCVVQEPKPPPELSHIPPSPHYRSRIGVMAWYLKSR